MAPLPGGADCTGPAEANQVALLELRARPRQVFRAAGGARCAISRQLAALPAADYQIAIAERRATVTGVPTR